jgi:hypothetical protein
MLLLLFVACAHVVTVQTEPTGAAIVREDTRVGNAPVDLPIGAFGKAEVTATLPGYRVLVATVKPLRWRRESQVELRLVEEHEKVE